MIKGFNKNYVFVKITYLKKTPNGNGAVSIARESVLHAFGNKSKALKYIAESTESQNHIGGEIITYQEALREYGQNIIMLAIELNEKIENFEKRRNWNC